MINTKFSKRKLKYYIDNNISYSNDQAVVNILLGDIFIGDIESAKSLADYLISNSFSFTRSSKIPVGVSYNSGETPYIKLQFAYALKKLYEMTGIASYQSEYTAILSRLNTNMDIGDTNAGLSSFVLLYDSSSILVPDFRSGFYASDSFPAIWYLASSYSTNASQCITYLKNSFDDFAGKSGIKLGFTPFYNLDLEENGTYGSPNEWYFDGPSGDETDFFHQYKTVFNLALYYWEKYRLKGKRDLNVKLILDKFFEYIIANANIPTEVSFPVLYAGSEDIYAGNEDIYAGQENLYDITYGDYNYKYAALLAVAGILKFKVDKEDNVFSYIETILSTLILNQFTDGSFNYTSGTELEAQSYTYMAFAMYESLTKKSYYDIVNEAFNLLNIDRINETNRTTHFQKNALDFCKEQINDILTKRYFEFTHTETQLTYSSGVYEYSLDALGIDPHRIECLGYYNSNGCWEEITEISYSKLLEYRNKDSSNTRAPIYFAVNQNKLYLYYTPDRDYSIKIWHYKLEDSSLNYAKIPSLLPESWAHVLKWHVAKEVALNRGNNLREYFEIWAKKTLSNLTYNDAVDMSEEYQRASSVRWN